MEFETTTLEAVYQQPSVSDIALQIMLAALEGGKAVMPAAAFLIAEEFVAERDKREAATGWQDYPENLPSTTGHYLVEYTDGKLGLEVAHLGHAGIRFYGPLQYDSGDVSSFHQIPRVPAYKTKEI